MPGFSLCLPQFLRSRRPRSRSPKPSQLRPHNDAGVLQTSNSSASRASSSRPRSEQALKPAPEASRPLAPGYPVDPQNSADRLFVHKAQGNLSHESPRAPRSITPIDVGSAAQQPARSTSPSNPTNPVQAQKPPPLPAAYRLMTSSQQSFNSEPLSQPLSQYFPGPQHQNVGMFNQAEHFSATGNFVYGNVGSISYNHMPSNQFMKELLEKTIPGAEFDSSDRDPPPRCHPGTRLAIVEHCLYFISNCNGAKKIRWVVGAAGVGKSAIMQNVAESPELAVSYHASIFFSINGRSDGTKTFITLSYQFAAKSVLYRQVIEEEISRDPSLLRSSMAKQFNKLIVQPFIHNPRLNSAGRVLAIIDGLDECSNPDTQVELLRLISECCITHPSLPIVWLIASRPEAHIVSFFSKSNVIPAYEKEEIRVDSNEARADVERYLRDKLTAIREASTSIDARWPDERDLWKLADAAGGLFAYAHTAIRYIADPMIGSPVSQLSELLNIIDEHPMTGVLREEHPMALLDALYDRILSHVPAKIMVNTRKLLLTLAFGWNEWLRFSGSSGDFIVLCNWLGMTRDEAYAALNHLYSVLYIPPRDKAHEEKLEPIHKSFIDYVSDFTRSGFSRNTEHEGGELMIQCALRILKDAPDGVDFGDMNYEFFYGGLARGPGTGDNISLTWIADLEVDWDDNETRLSLYKLAIGEVVARMEDGHSTFLNEPYIRLLTTRFEWYVSEFPYLALCDLVFDKSRRSEFLMKGILRETTLEIVDFSEAANPIDIKLRFRRPTTTVTDSSDPWDDSCGHERTGQWEEGKNQDWRTTFDSLLCDSCSGRLKRQLEDWKTRSPDHVVPILSTSALDCCVEFRFVDPEDGMSEWAYWFWCRIPFDERKRYGMLV